MLETLRSLARTVATFFTIELRRNKKILPSPILARRTVVTIRAFETMTADPPPMQWSPCHPRTAQRFKASMTCPNGHGLTLRNHAISRDGVVMPSVVCPKQGCSFHEFVRLDRWIYGEIPQ